jgi:hypothetical protein
VILGQQLVARIAGGIGQHRQPLAARPKAGHPRHRAGDGRFADVEDAEGIEEKAVHMVGHLLQRGQVQRLRRIAGGGQAGADRLIPREGLRRVGEQVPRRGVERDLRHW